MHKKFEINGTKIKGGCQSGRKFIPYESKSDLPLKIPLYLWHNTRNGKIGGRLTQGVSTTRLSTRVLLKP